VRVKPRDEAKEAAILAATLHEVEKVGLSGLSMEAVAKRAKVATGTVYIYFRNKDALVDALYLKTKQDLASLVFKEPEQPVRIAFARMCKGYLEYVLEHRAEMVFMSQVAHSPYVSAPTKAAVELGVRPITDLLDRGKREALLKPLETSTMLFFLQGTLKEMANVLASKTKKERPAFLEDVVALCWDALKA
jgi:AcrR family transcriptional regulator